MLGFILETALKTHTTTMRTPLFTLLVSLLLAGCGAFSIAPHKIEIQQGNLITQETAQKLSPGMSRAQVRSILGSPLIADAFHDNRWDYVYRLEQKGKLVEQRKLVVFFEGDRMVRVESGLLPTTPVVAAPATPAAAPAPAPAAGGATTAAPTPAQPATESTEADKPTKEKGFFGRMLEKIGL